MAPSFLPSPLLPFPSGEAPDANAVRRLFRLFEADFGHAAMGADELAQFDALAAGTGQAKAAVGRDGDRYTQVAPALNEPDEWMLAAVDGSGDDSGTVLAELVGAGRDLAAGAGSKATRWWVSNPGPSTDQVAAAAGFQPLRGLYFMRVALPLASDGRPPLEVEAFRPGLDDAAFLETNNAAFAGHPEQGNWGPDALAARQAEDWFDPAGFLLHWQPDERPGATPGSRRVAGFCWTKVHDELDPPEGEIFVIAAHPDFHGRGLGRSLTRAGLDHLARDRGMTIGQLYVDDANEPAVGLYRSLGFTVARADRCYQWTRPGA